MTQITVRQEKEAVVLLFQGHAGTERTGNNIVCAAISSIVQALSGFLLNYARPQDVYVSERTSGQAKFYFRLTRDTKPAFLLCLTGLKQIAHDYPEQVSLKEILKP